MELSYDPFTPPSCELLRWYWGRYNSNFDVCLSRSEGKAMTKMTLSDQAKWCRERASILGRVSDPEFAQDANQLDAIAAILEAVDAVTPDARELAGKLRAGALVRVALRGTDPLEQIYRFDLTHEQAEALVAAALVDRGEMMAAQAYQVIGSLVDSAGCFDDPAVQRALDYFSQGKHDENFLPWFLTKEPVQSEMIKGWKLVPVEPTREMILAVSTDEDTSVSEDYVAMVRAAPSPHKR